VLLWIAPLVQRWLRDGSVRHLAVTAFAAQVLVANVAVAGALAYVLLDTRRVAAALPTLCRAVPPAPVTTPSESPGIVRACGGRPALHPFIVASLTARGLWDERPFVADLRAGRYPALLLPFDPAAGVYGVQSTRWSPAVIAAMAGGYEPRERAAGWWVLVPRVGAP
jgi:hypothetical protein